MVVREDLVESAVSRANVTSPKDTDQRRSRVRSSRRPSRLPAADHTAVLQDPSVANAPLEKRIAFLQSKNLTQEEVDASLARAADGPSHAASPVTQSSAPSNYAYRPPQSAPAYGSYPPSGYWQPPPPPEYATFSNPNANDTR